MYGCNCLCEINHPKNLGICTGYMDTTVMFTVPEEISGPIRGRREVDMCNHCATAMLVARREREKDVRT